MDICVLIVSLFQFILKIYGMGKRGGGGEERWEKGITPPSRIILFL